MKAYLAGLCALALVIAGCGTRSEAPDVVIPTATPTHTPVRTPPPVALAPTATPSPTALPVPTATPTRTPTPTPTPTPPPSIASAKAAALLVATLGVGSADVDFESIHSIDWPTPALGCPEPGRSYASVIVRGWMILLRHDQKLYEYHADESGERVTTCDPKLVRTYGSVNPSKELDLAETTRIEVGATADGVSGGGTVLTIDQPGEIARIVTSLSLDLPLYDPKPCKAMLSVSFYIGARTETVLYACSGDGSVLRMATGPSMTKEARAPEQFQRLINEALSTRPFPSMPEAP